jgi:hypothetical protein
MLNGVLFSDEMIAWVLLKNMRLPARGIFRVEKAK